MMRESVHKVLPLDAHVGTEPVPIVGVKPW